MVRKNSRLLLMVSLCSIAGVVVGGTSGWAETNSCLQAPIPTAECLTTNPTLKTIEGMSVGLVAGVGAALGAAWQAKRGEL